MTDVTQQLDARGLTCPLPILRTKKAISTLARGDVLEVLSTDPGSSKDVDAFCQQTGNEYLSSEERDGTFVIRIRKS